MTTHQFPFSLKIEAEKIIPRKVDVFNWINNLENAKRKQKDKAKKAKLKIIIDEFKTLTESL